MKKLVLLFIIFGVLVGCGEKKREAIPPQEKQISINVFDEKKEKSKITVLDDDGMVYLDKKNLINLIKIVPEFTSVKTTENDITYISGDYQIIIDFVNNQVTKKLTKTNHKISNNKDDSLSRIYLDYLAQFNVNESKIPMKFYNEDFIYLYDIMNFSNMAMARNSKEFSELLIARGLADIPTLMTKKTNEASYDLLMLEIKNLIKLNLVDKDNENYLIDNKEKFINNFYKEIILFIKKVDRGHFGAYAFNDLNSYEKTNNFLLCGRKMGDKLYSELNNTITKEMNSKTAYIKINSFIMEKSLFEEFEKAMDKSYHYENLIIDLRNNLGGLVANELYLLSLLTNKPITEYFITGEGNKKYIIPNPSSKDYKGNLIILVNNNSISASNTFANTIKIHKLATVIGEKTGGQSDPINETVLPNNMRISKSTLRLFTDDKFQSIDKGIEPDIFVEDVATAKDNDPILTKALDLCK